MLAYYMLVASLLRICFSLHGQISRPVQRKHRDFRQANRCVLIKAPSGANCHLESLLNGGRIEFNSLVDTLLPFLKCLSSNFYDVTVQMQGDYKLFEFASDSNLSEIHGESQFILKFIIVNATLEEFPFYPLVYFTQPSDLLNEERIKFYEKQIQSGIRPAALALRAGMEIFVIDGHHKV